MRTGTSQVVLAMAVAVLGAVAAGWGLLSTAAPGVTQTFTSIHGETVELFARGLYRFDSRFIGAGFVGQDAVTLVLAVPALLAVSWRDWHRPSVLWVIAHCGLLTYFAYVCDDVACGVL